jgi:hypothetical protein
LEERRDQPNSREIRDPLLLCSHLSKGSVTELKWIHIGGETRILTTTTSGSINLYGIQENVNQNYSSMISSKTTSSV